VVLAIASAKKRDRFGVRAHTLMRILETGFLSSFSFHNCTVVRE
jgi:hypothetical protein